MKSISLATLLVLAAAAPAGAAVESSAEAAQPRYAQVDGFRFFGRLDSWRAVDRDTLIVWATPARPYLVELMRPSPGLRFAQSIGLTSTVGRVNAKLDSVIVRGIDYPIEAIFELSRDEARRYGAETDGHA